MRLNTRAVLKGHHIVGYVAPTPATPVRKAHVYKVTEAFSTLGGEHYVPGDKLFLLGRTKAAPHGILSSLGNWVVVGKNRRQTVWSSIDWMAAKGMIVEDGHI
jgi:hypothetical protein